MIALWLSLALAAEVPEEKTEVAEAGAEASEEGAEAVEESPGPDRSSPPAVIPGEWLDLDEPVVHDLGDGVEVWHVRIPGVRKVEIGVRLHAGSYELDGGPTELAQQSMNMADLGTASHDPVALEIEQDVYEVDVWSWIGHHAGGVGMTAPLEELERGLGLVGELLHEPAFPKKELKQSQRDTWTWLTVNAPSSQGRVMYSTLTHAWYPADHPYGARPDLKGIRKQKTAALAEKQAAWRTSGPVTVLVVGDVAFEDVEPMVRQAVDGIGSPGDPAEEVDFTPPASTRVVAVDMPGQTQTSLAVRYAAPTLTDPDRVGFDTLNWVFGGHFLSRLNANLREDKGFTYGSRSGYGAWDKRGTMTVSVDVKAENTGAAIREIEAELARLIDEPPTAEELDMARQSFVSDWNGTRETASTAQSFYNALLVDRESVADARARAEAMEALSGEALATIAERWLKDQPHVWVVVGDRASIEAQLEGLGAEVEWIAPVDAIRGSF